MTSPANGNTDFVHGVGGRLRKSKSRLYQESVAAVEARGNKHVARYMLVSDLAYVMSAMEVDATPHDEGRKLLACILELLADVDRLASASDAADIVSQRESWVISKVGKEIGSRLHVGRNRGESIRNILPRLFLRQALHDEAQALFQLIQVLHRKAEPALDALAPVYHHLQHASVTTLGEYLLSWARGLYPDLERMRQIDARLALAPPSLTGRSQSVAIAERVGQRLAFSETSVLRQELHVTEDHLTEPFFALVQTNVTLSRLASDLRIWMSDEFAFFDLDDMHANASSLLPQKKNAFSLQMVIGGASVSIGRLAAQLGSSVGPSEELDSIFPIASLYDQSRDIVGWTKLMTEIVEHGTFRLDELRAKAMLGNSGASEALDKLVFDVGLPLRIAHHVLGALVRSEIEGGQSFDLRAEIEKEMGCCPEFDADELVAIVRGEVVPDTALAHDAVHAEWKRLSENIERDRVVYTGPSPIEAAIANVVDEASSLLSA